MYYFSDPYNIFVKTLTGRTIEFDMNRTDTIRDLKVKIWDKEGNSLDSQRLVYQGRQLEDDFTLEDYGMF